MKEHLLYTTETTGIYYMMQRAENGHQICIQKTNFQGKFIMGTKLPYSDWGVRNVHI